MVTSKQTNDNFTSTVGTKTNQFEIAEESQAFIIEALSKNIYKDPVGTIIREYCSNAWDANVEAGVNEPILVELNQDLTGKFFSVTDFGAGLSEEKIRTVFVKYGKSTKSKGNSEIGGFGIGAKSAFAYTDVFFVNTVSEGNLYRYMVSKTNEKPEMSLVYSDESGTHRNGTEIKIYLTEESDWYDFDTKIQRQMLHFQNVIYKVKGELYAPFMDKEVFDHDLFQVTSESRLHFDSAYALVGPVAYPISYNQLGLPNFNVPVGIRFNIGELDVILSREELRYTAETIKNLKEKLEIVRLALDINIAQRKLWVKTADEFYEKSNSIAKFVFGKIEIDIPLSMLSNKHLRYKVAGLHPEFRFPVNDLPFLAFHAAWDGKNVDRESNPKISYYNIFKNNSIVAFLHDDRVLSQIKLKWLNSQYPNKKIYLLKEADLEFKDYKNISGVKNIETPIISERGNFTGRIMSFKKLIERPIINKLIKLSEVEVPQYFIDSLKAVNTNVALKGLEFNDLMRPFGKTFNKVRIDGDKIHIDRNTTFKLSEVVIVYGCENGFEDFEAMKALKEGDFIKQFLSFEKTRWGDRNLSHKKVLVIQAESKKQLVALKTLDCAMHLNDAKKIIKPTKLMKQLREETIFNRMFRGNRSEMFKLLRDHGKLDDLKFPPIFDTSSRNKGNRSISYWNRIFYGSHHPENGFEQEKGQTPPDWIYFHKKIKRYEKSFKEHGILRLDIFRINDFKSCSKYRSNSQIMLEEILTKKSILPSLNAYQPIFDWEHAILRDNKIKQDYLQSLV